MSPIENLILFTTLLTLSGFIFKGVLRYLEKHPKNKHI